MSKASSAVINRKMENVVVGHVNNEWCVQSSGAPNRPLPEKLEFSFSNFREMGESNACCFRTKRTPITQNAKNLQFVLAKLVLTLAWASANFHPCLYM